jgi:putative inorganic carbon (HCO3(-)) transporter
MPKYNQPELAMEEGGGTAIQFARRAVPATSISYWLLLIFVFLLYTSLPLQYPALEAVRPAQLTAIAALIILSMEVVFAGRSFDPAWPQGYALLGFLGAAALSCSTALWPRLAFESTLDFLKIALIFFVVVNCVDSERRVRGLMWVMLIGGLAPAAGALRYYAAGQTVEGRAHWLGIFANPNELAASLVVLLPLAGCLAAKCRLTGRVVLLGFSLLYAAAIFLTFSRGGLVGLLAALLLYAWRRRSAAVLCLLAAAASVGLVSAGRYWSRDEGFSDLSQDVSFRQRLATSRAGLAMFADHPLLGVGFGCSLIAWPLYAPEDLYRQGRGELVTHNTFIQPLSETGLAGFIPFILFLGSGLATARKLARRRPAGSITPLAAGLEIALWGFAVCGLSGGYVLSWFPYILTGLICSAKRAAEQNS